MFMKIVVQTDELLWIFLQSRVLWAPYGAYGDECDTFEESHDLAAAPVGVASPWPSGLTLATESYKEVIICNR